MTDHTPDQAKEKWCPEARETIAIYGTITGSVRMYALGNRGRVEGKDAFSLCLATACMLWVWTDEERTKGRCGLAHY